jgi:hypothetical protein
MKKIFVLSMLVSLVIIGSCQKQESATEQQFAERKTELDARETSLHEKEKALEARERALAERENAIANTSKIRPDLQSRRPISNAAEAKAERDRRIQQLPPELRALVPDPSQVRAESRRQMRESDPAQAQVERQLRPEDLDRQWQRKLDKAKISAEGFAATPESSEPEVPSPSPSATPQ